jgi:uncharacterized protein (DUF1501 family)
MSPLALWGHRSAASALTRLDDFVLRRPEGPKPSKLSSAPSNDLIAFVLRNLLDAYATAERMEQVVAARAPDIPYPDTPLAARLRLVASLLKERVGTRVFYPMQSGYDTHYFQLPAHAALLAMLSGALRAFLDDLVAAKLAERVVVLCFSEFGRRIAENSSDGTDHGTAGPVLLAGPMVRPGLVGPSPNLLDLHDGDLKWSIDFRRLYATVLEHWLGLSHRHVLEGSFQPLPLFRGSV